MKNFTLVIISLFSTSLIFTSCTKKGCTDPSASNYEENADREDGSCKNFTRFTFGTISVRDIPTNNSGSFWDNSVIQENQAPDPYIAIFDNNGTLIDQSTSVYPNSYPTDEDPMNFTLQTNSSKSDFTAIYNVYLLDNDNDNPFTDQIIAVKTIDLNILTDKNSSSKFPSSVSINNLDTDLRISLNWLE